MAGVCLSWAAARWIGPHGFLDHPKGRHAHDRPVPRTGGFALLGALLLGGLVGQLRTPHWAHDWFGLLAFGALGILDDRYQLRARTKAVLTLALALALAWPEAGMVVAAQPHATLLGLALPPTFPVALTLTFLLIWFTPHALNLIDGANGLAIGFGLVVLLGLATHGSVYGFLLGTLTALLLMNWPKAKHFLGDGGSLALGFLLSQVLIESYGTTRPTLILWTLAYPAADILLVCTIRRIRGQPLGKGDRSHLHHQWADRFPRHKCWVVPGLLAQAALCASPSSAHGWTWIFPLLGIALLGGQVLLFVLASREEGPIHLLPPPVLAYEYSIEDSSESLPQRR